jgi:hypothetical protein
VAHLIEATSRKIAGSIPNTVTLCLLLLRVVGEEYQITTSVVGV